MKKYIILSLVLVLALSMAVPVFAGSSDTYVMDTAGLLTTQERTELERYAGQIQQQYHCGVYIVTVADFRDYGYSDIFDFTWNFYHQLGLGSGADREGMILMLSMADRDYATFFYGDRTESIFTTRAQIRLEDGFLPFLGNNRWMDGFRQYQQDAMTMLSGGKTKSADTLQMTLIVVAGLWVLAGIFTLIVWFNSSNVRTQTHAAHYAVANSLHVTYQKDRLVNRVVSRRKVDSDSGSSSRRGGGGSGRSGKF